MKTKEVEEKEEKDDEERTGGKNGKGEEGVHVRVEVVTTFPLCKTRNRGRQLPVILQVSVGNTNNAPTERGTHRQYTRRKGTRNDRLALEVKKINNGAL